MNSNARRYARLACVAIVLTAATISSREEVAASGDGTGTADDLRQAFQLELWNFIFEAPEIYLTAGPPDRVRFHVAETLTRRIADSALRVDINNEPAGIACGTRKRAGRYLKDCDLRLTPRLALHKGKNSLRISVNGTPYEASYVVLLEDASTSEPPSMAREVSRNLLRDDAEPPSLDVKPRAASGAGNRTVTIAGTVSDNVGVFSLTIQGRAVSSTQPGANPASVAFTEEVDVPPDGAPIVVESRDRTGNLTRVLIRVQEHAVLDNAFAGRRVAVVIGVSEYQFRQDTLPNLKFASSDARAIQQLLSDPKGAGFAAGDVHVLLDKDATRLAVRDALKTAAAPLGAGDLLLVYINSHGTPDPFAIAEEPPFYFLFHDGRMSSLAETAMPMNAIAELLSGPQFDVGHKVILIDTCHSGKVAELSTQASRELARAAGTFARQKNVALMTSAAPGETAAEREDLKAGVFSYALRQALLGGADVNGDGRVTVNELFNSVRTCVQQLTGNHQHPEVLSSANVDWPLVTVGSVSRMKCIQTH